MNTTETELFTRDFYIALKQKWLAYIKEEVHISPEYFLFYTLVKGKSPFKVFSPLVSPKKIEIAARERSAGPWGALENSIASLSNSLKSASQSGKFTLIGSQKNRQYDASARKWTYDQTNHDIALTSEQVAFLQERIAEANTKVDDKALYAYFQDLAAKAKEVNAVKRAAAAKARLAASV